jgi:L-ascorbate metabolism protein UlaG (beta-lactamase superfamily)
MRYASALERLRAGTDRAAAPVPRPPAGTVSVTFVGHATVMITTPETRVLVDPLLENSLTASGGEAPRLPPADLDDVDLALITHAHRDHLSGKSLGRLPNPPRSSSPSAAARRRVGLLEVIEPPPAPATRSRTSR